MLKGKQLIDYTVNRIGGDKLKALHTLVDEVVGHFDNDTEELMKLVNPYDLYMFLEGRILNQTYYDEQIIKFLKKRDIPLPTMWGWKCIQNGIDGVIEENDRFNDKNDCYYDMYKRAMYITENAIGLEGEAKITAKYPDSIIVESQELKCVFTVYEM